MVFHHRVATEGFTEEARRGGTKADASPSQATEVTPKPTYYPLLPTTYYYPLPFYLLLPTPYPLLPFLLNLLRHLLLYDLIAVTPIGEQFLLGTHLRDLPFPQYNDLVEF